MAPRTERRTEGRAAASCGRPGADAQRARRTTYLRETVAIPPQRSEREVERATENPDALDGERTDETVTRREMGISSRQAHTRGREGGTLLGGATRTCRHVGCPYPGPTLRTGTNTCKRTHREVQPQAAAAQARAMPPGGAARSEPATAMRDRELPPSGEHRLQVLPDGVADGARERTVHGGGGALIDLRYVRGPAT